MSLPSESLVADWRSELDRSVWAWRAGKSREGIRACERVLYDPHAPMQARWLAMANATWYMPLLGELLERVEFHPLLLPVPSGWTCFNPSLVRSETGELLAAVRSANYRIGSDGNYIFADKGGILNKSFLVGLTEELCISWTVPLVAPGGVEAFPCRIKGYEDIRLVRAGGATYGLATVRDRHSHGLCRVALLEIDSDGSVRRDMVLESPDPARHEKNWVPFPLTEEGGELAVRTGLVYQWGPIVLWELDLASGALHQDGPSGAIHQSGLRVASSLAPGARGGTQGVVLGDGVLFVVHYAVLMQDGTRRYPHQFVLLDEGLQFSGASPMFFFLHRGVEFATGLCLEGDSLLMSFGSDDSTAWIARCRVEAVLGLINKKSVSVD